MVLKHLEGLRNLLCERLRGVKQEEQNRIVQLKEHTCDLAGELRLLGLDQRVETLADHLLLLVLWNGIKVSQQQRSLLGRLERQLRGRRTKLA